MNELLVDPSLAMNAILSADGIIAERKASPHRAIHPLDDRKLFCRQHFQSSDPRHHQSLSFHARKPLPEAASDRTGAGCQQKCCVPPRNLLTRSTTDRMRPGIFQDSWPSCEPFVDGVAEYEFPGMLPQSGSINHSVFSNWESSMRDTKSVARLLRLLRISPLTEEQAKRAEAVLFESGAVQMSPSENIIFSMELLRRQVGQNPTGASAERLRQALLACENKLASLAAQSAMATHTQVSAAVTSMDQAALKSAIHDVMCELKVKSAQIGSLESELRMPLLSQLSYVLGAASKLVKQNDLESAYFLLLGLNSQMAEAIDTARGIFNPLEI